MPQPAVSPSLFLHEIHVCGENSVHQLSLYSILFTLCCNGEAVAEFLAYDPPEPVVLGSIPSSNEL